MLERWGDRRPRGSGATCHPAPSVAVRSCEILRDPGWLWLLSAASPASQRKLSLCFPGRPAGSWRRDLTSSGLPREPQ